MPKRKTRTKRVVKRKVSAKKSGKMANRKAHWKAYKELQMRAEKAWKKLDRDVKKKAGRNVLIRDRNDILLILGECNYMAREYMRMAAKSKKR